jgi:hypothetical protein
MGCIALGFVVSVFVSIALASNVLRKPKSVEAKSDQLSN